MPKPLTKLIVKLMREYADKIETGNCELSEDEQTNILSILSHRVLSKEDACKRLNLQRSRFDDLVRLGKIPRGRKRTGFKELVWYEDELDAIVNSK